MGEYVCVFLSVDLKTDSIAIVNFGKGNHFLEGTQEQLKFLGFSFDSFPCCSVIVLSLSFCLVCQCCNDFLLLVCSIGLLNTINSCLFVHRISMLSFYFLFRENSLIETIQMVEQKGMLPVFVLSCWILFYSTA